MRISPTTRMSVNCRIRGLRDRGETFAAAITGGRARFLRSPLNEPRSPFHRASTSRSCVFDIARHSPQTMPDETLAVGAVRMHTDVGGSALA